MAQREAAREAARGGGLALLVTGGEAGVDFPLNGMVALVTDDEGETWRELRRL